MFKCKKSNREFKTERGLVGHLRNQYSSIEEAYLNEQNKSREKCVYCGCTQKFISFKKGYYVHCGGRKCIKKHLTQSNNKLAKQRKNKKKPLNRHLIRWLLTTNYSNETNIDVLGTNTQGITVWDYLGRNYIKFKRHCKYCDSLFEVPFDNLTKHHCNNKNCVQLYRHNYYKIKNKMEARELNNKWFELNKSMHYKKANVEIKKFMKHPSDFTKIFNHMGDEQIIIDGWNFNIVNNSSALLLFLEENINEIHWKHLVYTQCKNCKKIANKDISLKKEYKKQFCSHKCYIDYKISNPQKFIYKESTKLKQSLLIKQKILDGSFTPCTTNSWCRSRVYYDKIAFRSSWEVLFYLLNQYDSNLQYEKLRIPYSLNSTEYIYIVDFIDNITKNVFEIKPNSEKDTIKNRAKKESLLNWCIQHEYTYNLITEDYFLKQEISLEIRNVINKLNLDAKLKQFL